MLNGDIYPEEEEAAVFVYFCGEMRQGVESRHRDVGLWPNITAF